MNPEYMLTANELSQLENLNKVTLSISELYEKLIILEMNNMLNTQDYFKVLDYLNMTLELESKMYKDLQLNLSNCDSINRCLIIMQNDYLASPLKDEAKTIINNQTFRRMQNNIHLYRNSILHNKINSIDSIYFGFERAFELEYKMKFLILLQDGLDNEYYESFKNSIYTSKYNLLFENSEIETEMIKNNFNPYKSNIFDSIFEYYCKKASYNEYNNYKNSFASTKSLEYIKYILSQDDSKYEDDKIFSNITINQVYLRSSLTMLDDLSIFKIENYLKKLKANYRDNKLSIYFLEETIKMNNYDMELIKTSTNYPKK